MPNYRILWHLIIFVAVNVLIYGRLQTLGLLAATSLPTLAENRTVTVTVDGRKQVIELNDTVVDGKDVVVSFKNLSNFSTWLYRIAIAYNEFYSYLRSRKETDDLDTVQVDAQCGVRQEDIGQKMDLYRALATLKDIERTCITLF